MADWSCLSGIFTEEDQKNINDFIGKEMKKYVIYPPNKDIFNVFKYCDLCITYIHLYTPTINIAVLTLYITKILY